MENQNQVAKYESMDLDVIDQGPQAFDGPSGYEGVDRECTIIPFLKMAQSSTDEAKKGNPSRIDGLEVGGFFCPTSRKVYGDRIELVILRFYRQYTVYESREVDAKFMGTMAPEDFHKIESQCTRERSYFLDAEGHRYVDTRNFIVFVHGHYDDGPMLLSLSSTGIKPSQKWLTQAQNVRSPDGRLAPIWANVWELTTAYFDNPLGSYYQISSINRLGWVPVKRRELIVSAFLDANNLPPEELAHSFEKPASDASMKVAEPAEAQRTVKPQDKARPATPNEPDIF